jgi:hypothetical protein
MEVLLVFGIVFVPAGVVGLFVSLLAKRAWVAPVVLGVAALPIIRTAYVDGVGFDGEPLVFALLYYALIVLGAVIGGVLSIPIRRWLLLRRISRN